MPTVTVRLERASDTLHVYRVDGLDPDEPLGHRVYVPYPAESFLDRVVRHELPSVGDALAQVMREHYERLNGSIPKDLVVTVEPAE